MRAPWFPLFVWILAIGSFYNMATLTEMSVHGWNVPAIQPSMVDGAINPSYDPLRANYTARLEFPCDASQEKINSDLMAMLVGNGAMVTIDGGCIMDAAYSDGHTYGDDGVDTASEPKALLNAALILSWFGTIATISLLVIVMCEGANLSDNEKQERCCEECSHCSRGALVWVVMLLTIQWVCWLTLFNMYAVDGKEGYLCGIRVASRNPWNLPVALTAFSSGDNTLKIWSAEFGQDWALANLKPVINNPLCPNVTVFVNDVKATYQFQMFYTFAPDAISTIRSITHYYWMRTYIALGFLGASFAIPCLYFLLPLLWLALLALLSLLRSSCGLCCLLSILRSSCGLCCRWWARCCDPSLSPRAAALLTPATAMSSRATAASATTSGGASGTPSGPTSGAASATAFGTSSDLAFRPAFGAASGLATDAPASAASTAASTTPPSLYPSLNSSLALSSITIHRLDNIIPPPATNPNAR